MKTVLITGYRGFTGQYVAEVFRNNGYHVLGMVRQEPRDNEIYCDLTDKDGVNAVIKKFKPDGIIHLAAQSFVGHDDPSAFYQINIFGALNLLEAMAKAVLPQLS